MSETTSTMMVVDISDLDATPIFDQLVKEILDPWAPDALYELTEIHGVDSANGDMVTLDESVIVDALDFSEPERWYSDIESVKAYLTAQLASRSNVTETTWTRYMANEVNALLARDEQMALAAVAAPPPPPDPLFAEVLESMQDQHTQRLFRERPATLSDMPGVPNPALTEPTLLGLMDP